MAPPPPTACSTVASPRPVFHKLWGRRACVPLTLPPSWTRRRRGQRASVYVISPCRAPSLRPQRGPCRPSSKVWSEPRLSLSPGSPASRQSVLGPPQHRHFLASLHLPRSVSSPRSCGSLSALPAPSQAQGPGPRPSQGQGETQPGFQGSCLQCCF